ncbi:unnamed protein product [Pleuronectes platessa]|uniref:Uncharacterized protein n=1 Tax=Pleuronectes platessa TaxID=8262 RepID=A0A9N7UDT1_PLEPL|nr:unnamed protein product [Pleuronectes platessa]
MFTQETNYNNIRTSGEKRFAPVHSGEQSHPTRSSLLPHVFFPLFGCSSSSCLALLLPALPGGYVSPPGTRQPEAKDILVRASGKFTTNQPTPARRRTAQEQINQTTVGPPGDLHRRCQVTQDFNNIATTSSPTLPNPGRTAMDTQQHNLLNITTIMAH